MLRGVHHGSPRPAFNLLARAFRYKYICACQGRASSQAPSRIMIKAKWHAWHAVQAMQHHFSAVSLIDEMWPSLNVAPRGSDVHCGTTVVSWSPALPHGETASGGRGDGSRPPYQRRRHVEAFTAVTAPPSSSLPPDLARSADGAVLEGRCSTGNEGWNHRSTKACNIERFDAGDPRIRNRAGEPVGTAQRRWVAGMS